MADDTALKNFAPDGLDLVRFRLSSPIELVGRFGGEAVTRHRRRSIWSHAGAALHDVRAVHGSEKSR